MATWRVAEAKARFSAVLDKAVSEGPQLVTRRSQQFYVVTKAQLEDEKLRVESKPSVSAWDALKPSFDERFRDVEFPRLSSKPRLIDLD